MTVYTIDSDKNIMVHATMESAQAECKTADGVVRAHHFTTFEQFDAHQSKFPPKYLVDLFNDNFGGMPGYDDCKPIGTNRFTNREAAVKRIWNLMQRLKPTDGNVTTMPSATVEHVVIEEIGTPAVTVNVTEGAAQDVIQRATPTPVDTALAGAAAATPPPAAKGPTKAELAAKKAQERADAKKLKAQEKKDAKAAKLLAKQTRANTPKPAPDAKKTYLDIADKNNPEADPLWAKLNGKNKRFALLNRQPTGLGLNEMMAIFHTQKHTERAFLSQGGAVGKSGLRSYHFADGDDIRYTFHKVDADAANAANAQREADAAKSIADAKAAMAPAPAAPATATEQPATV